MANLFIQELETKLTDKEQESNLGSLMMFNKPKTRRSRLWQMKGCEMFGR